jgi:hypothetical protein
MTKGWSLSSWIRLPNAWPANCENPPLNLIDNDHRLREKLSPHFKEQVVPDEYGVILFENCVIHLIEDDAIPSEGLVKYDGQQRGSFFLKRTQLQEANFQAAEWLYSGAVQTAQSGEL